MLKKLLLATVAVTVMLSGFAQTAREEIEKDPLKGGANLRAYPDPEPSYRLTPTPKGYEPFYMSHYGRHGSRWLCGANQYTEPLAVLEKAHEKGVLTVRGELLLRQLKTFYEKSALNRAGELTWVGEAQHHRIGRRMTERFPEIFSAKDCRVDARSTVVIRCILSMEAECEELMANNRYVTMHNDVSESFQWYMNAPWSGHYNEKYKEAMADIHFNATKEFVNPERFWSVLMKDTAYRDSKREKTWLMKKVFDVCENMQSHFTEPRRAVLDGVSMNMFDVFTADEIYSLWKVKNVEWYCGHIYKDLEMSQRNLLENILNTADTIDVKSFRGATLRFGHEVDVLPLAACLGLGNVDLEVSPDSLATLDRTWRNYNYYPMACNVQLIFYRPKGGKSGDILVKALLNEREVTMPGKPVCGPYYRWAELERLYRKKIEEFDR